MHGFALRRLEGGMKVVVKCLKNPDVLHRGVGEITSSKNKIGHAVSLFPEIPRQFEKRYVVEFERSKS